MLGRLGAMQAKRKQVQDFANQLVERRINSSLVSGKESLSSTYAVLQARNEVFKDVEKFSVVTVIPAGLCAFDPWRIRGTVMVGGGQSVSESDRE